MSVITLKKKRPLPGSIWGERYESVVAHMQETLPKTGCTFQGLMDHPCEGTESTETENPGTIEFQVRNGVDAGRYKDLIPDYEAIFKPI